MDKELVKKEFKEIIDFPRAFSNKLKIFDKSELEEYLKFHPEFENIKALIRCICLDIELPICRVCRKNNKIFKKKK